MNIPEPNAFTINSFGSSFFPFSMDVSQKEDITNAFLCAQRILDICDIIGKYAADNLVLFQVDQISLYDEREERPFTLERIAASANVPFSAIDAETIVLKKEAFKPLLSKFHHDNLFAIDIGSQWNESEVINQVITCLEHDWGADKFLLAKLPTSQNLILSHDDCYLTIQTRNPAFVKQVFARALQIYAGTVLAENHKIQPDVTEIPEKLLTSIWQKNFGLTILRETTQVEEDGLRIGVAKKPFNFREEAEYIPEYWIRYELTNQRWMLEK